MITSIRGSIHQGHETFSEHSRGRQVCIYVTSSFAFQSIEFGRFMDTRISMTSYVVEIACIYMHSVTNKMVPNTNSLSIEELPEVATSQNNVEYRLNYNRFYQGRIGRSF